MELPELSKVLAGSEYEEHLECLDRVVGTMKIVTMNDLENSVRFIGPKVCGGVSTNAFISYVVAWCKSQPPEPEPVAPVKPKRKSRKKKKAVEPEPEMVIDEPEPAVEAQADNDTAVEDALIPE